MFVLVIHAMAACDGRHRTALGLRGEQGAHVDARADDAVITRPSAKHLARTAAQIQHPRPRRQTQCRTERGVFVGRERPETMQVKQIS